MGCTRSDLFFWLHFGKVGFGVAVVALFVRVSLFFVSFCLFGVFVVVVCVCVGGGGGYFFGSC